MPVYRQWCLYLVHQRISRNFGSSKPVQTDCIVYSVLSIMLFKSVGVYSSVHWCEGITVFFCTCCTKPFKAVDIKVVSLNEPKRSQTYLAIVFVEHMVLTTPKYWQKHHIVTLFELARLSHANVMSMVMGCFGNRV